MNNVYDNGAMIIGSVYNIKEYVCRNADDIEEIKDLIKDLEDIDEDSIVMVNYDNGMGYSIEWWNKSHLVNMEEKGDNMNKKEQLVEKIYNYYKNGIKNVNSLIDLKKEIKNNLETLQGVEDELDSCRIEFSVVKMNEERFGLLNEIWNELNNLKTEYEGLGK